MSDPKTLPVPQGPPEAEYDAFQGLTPKAVDFSRYYALSHNAEGSARLAGYRPTYGHQLLGDVRVQEVVAYYRELFASQTTYTPEKILHQWAQMASVDVTTLCDDEWTMKPPSQLTEDQRQALTGFEVIEKHNRRYIKPTFAKAQALEHLGRLHKMYQEDKSKGEGLSLHITLGQSVSVDGVAQTQSLGHIQITTHQALDEDAPEV
jgi:hypothetical protein